MEPSLPKMAVLLGHWLSQHLLKGLTLQRVGLVVHDQLIDGVKQRLLDEVELGLASFRLGLNTTVVVLAIATTCMTHKWYPMGHEGYPMGHEGYPMGHEGYPMGHEGYPMGHEGYPMGHEGYPMGHEGYPMGHEGYPMGHEGYPMGHEGYPMGHEGYTMGKHLHKGQ